MHKEHCIPVIAVRDMVLYPYMYLPLFIGRPRSIKAVQAASGKPKSIILATQKQDIHQDYPTPKELYNVGVLSHITQESILPDGSIKIFIESKERVRLDEVVDQGDFLVASHTILRSQPIEDETKVRHYIELILNKIYRVVKLHDDFMPDKFALLKEIKDLGHLVDTAVSTLPVSIEDKQIILESTDYEQRVIELLKILDADIEFLKIDKRIEKRVQKQLERSQKDYYLNEKVKAIHKEMGQENNPNADLEEMQKKAKKLKMTEEALKLFEDDIGKLKMMSPMSSESTVIRNHLEWLLKMPWGKTSKERYDILKAEKSLNKDHYSLDEAKERILEHLAVQKRVGHGKNTVIICLVGPPGVGKTSLGKSMARAMNRKYTRIALGGVKDEAEIRGHRRTYIGAMPGKIIQKLAKIKVDNPLVLLDEIDKLGSDHRGDPAAALLEVLDPEQNSYFNDHYMEVEYDLSKVMFVCTSNSMNIPAPLLDRMEIIRIPGYTQLEKIKIAQKHLIPRQLELNGLSKLECQFALSGIKSIVDHYTCEPGVRNLERQIAKVCRKIVIESQRKGKDIISSKVTTSNIQNYLGVVQYTDTVISKKDVVGQVTGLAWTESGGVRLSVECVICPGKGKQICTGSLGEVMQESVQAAVTLMRDRSHALFISPDFYDTHDIHVHFPAGATPKDGPSAGITICTALASALTNIAVRSNIAMTGEVTLSGKVLAIGGLKEKLLAAHRGNISKVLIPEENVKDLDEISEDIKSKLDIQPVKSIEEVLRHALVAIPKDKK